MARVLVARVPLSHFPEAVGELHLRPVVGQKRLKPCHRRVLDYRARGLRQVTDDGALDLQFLARQRSGKIVSADEDE